MKLIHTSDWHLGHTLHEISQAPQQRAFLAWLTGMLREQQVDALLIAGDIFDTANPSAEAQEIWYEFLVNASRVVPDLQIVAIGGNHDSAARLDAPKSLLKQFRVTVVGGLRHVGGRLDTQELAIPLRTNSNKIEAWVAAVPYIRMADVSVVRTSAADNETSSAAAQDNAMDPVIEGVRGIYAQVIDQISILRSSDQALIAMGHLYLARGEVSVLSERKVLGGNQHALPNDIFPPEVTYVALGHLHMAQRVGHESVWYSGAPLPFDVAEKDYPNQVRLVELSGAELVSSTRIPVPRTLRMLRLPDSGTLGFTEAVSALRQLPQHSPELEGKALLEVHVTLTGPEPTLRFEIEKALEGKGYHLVRIAAGYQENAQELAQQEAEVDLEQACPEEVLSLAWRTRYGNEVEEAIWPLFHEIVEQVQHGESSAAREADEVRS